jgi:hypothetical protein
MAMNVTMVFPFVMISDSSETETFRPVIPLRIGMAQSGQSQRCLVDTGSPSTFVDWRLAALAGVNLSQAEKLASPQKLSLAGVMADETWGVMLGFRIEDDHYGIHLGYVPTTFIRPWQSSDFTVILGTNAMKRITVVVEAGVGDGQLTISRVDSRGKKQ